MAFDFPSSPTVGQVSNGYVWNGFAWTGNGNLAAVAPPGATPPASPVNGQLWWDSTSGNLFLWYVDANSSQWVQISGPGLGDAPVDGKLYGRQSGVWVASPWRTVLNEVTAANKSEWVIPLAGLSALKIDVEIHPNTATGDRYLAWRISYDGGASYLAGGTDYQYEVLNGYGTTASAGGGPSSLGMLTTGWLATAAVAPMTAYARFIVAGVGFTPSMRSDFDGFAPSIGDITGTYRSRLLVASPSAPTHLQIFSTGVDAIGIGSRILVRGR